jgi:hypothetical protein
MKGPAPIIAPGRVILIPHGLRMWLDRIPDKGVEKNAGGGVPALTFFDPLGNTYGAFSF